MMNDLHKTISEMKFSSLCSGDITMPDKETIAFKVKQSFHNNRIEEFFCLRQTEDGLFLSDEGTTLANLDNTFELGEPDVIKNIVSVLKKFDMVKVGCMFVYRIDTKADVISQILRYLQGIHFLYAMKLFYD